jgi:hypothetical protein
MYRAPSKRRQLAQRIVVYALMSIGVIFVVTFLVFIMLGYRFNKETSSIQQGGLVQFNSRPGNASVRIGRADLTDVTPSKITVNPGDYTVRMERDSYHAWSKDVTVEAGKVLWLNYAQLIPKNIEHSVAAKFTAIAQTKASLDGRYLAIITKPSDPKLTFVRIDGSRVEQTNIEIESARSATTYKVQEWSPDASRLLVTASKAGSVRWLLAERDAKDPSDVIDLTSKYGSSLEDLHFDPRGSDRLVVRTKEKDLRLLNVSDDALSSIIIPNVEDYTFYADDHIMYVSKLDAKTKSLGYVSFSKTGSPRELKRIETTQPVKVAAASYFGDAYLAASVSTAVETYLLSGLPDSGSSDAITLETVATRVLPTAPRFLSLRASGRFVVMQYAGGFATYDIELDKDTMTSLKGIGTQELRWFDRYHPYVTDGSQLLSMEFDGANQHAIAPLTTQFDAVQTDDGKYIYSLQKMNKGSYELRRSQVILD